MNSIKLHDQHIEYKIKDSARAKRLRIAVFCDIGVVVTKPKSVSQNTIEKFLILKSSWILDKLEQFKLSANPFKNLDRESDYLNNKDKSLELAKKKVEEFNSVYRFQFNKINIKNQKTKWGSCSSKKNLNFNYKIIHLPENILNYIIVHELCHLGEFNHSQKFWKLVAKAIPDYLDIKKELKTFSF